MKFWADRWLSGQRHTTGTQRKGSGRMCSTGFIRNLELDYVGHQGQTISIEGNGTLVSTKSGPQLLALCRDITEREQAEEEIKKVKEAAEAARGEFEIINQQLEDAQKQADFANIGKATSWPG